MTDVENILNDDDFFRDVLDTPKEGTEQYKKQECLKSFTLKFVSDYFKTKRMCERAIQEGSYNLKFVPDHLKT